MGLITYVSGASADAVAALGGTTSLLLLGVFTIVNIVVLVLRRDRQTSDHFVTPSVLPVIGALCCFFLVLPFSGRPSEHYRIGGGLPAPGVVLWALTWMANRGLRAKKTYFRDTDDLGAVGPSTRGAVTLELPALLVDHVGGERSASAQPVASRLALARARGDAELLETPVEAVALDVGRGWRVDARLPSAHQSTPEQQLAFGRVVGRPLAVRGVVDELVTRRAVMEPGACIGTVVAWEGPAFEGHLVGRRDVEVGGKPPPLVIAHRVDRHRQDLVPLAVDDHQPEFRQCEQSDVEGDAGHHGAGLDATHGARGDAHEGGELPLAEVGATPRANDIPSWLVVGARAACCCAHADTFGVGTDSAVRSKGPVHMSGGRLRGVWTSRPRLRHCCMGCNSDVAGGSGHPAGGGGPAATSLLHGVQQ